MAKLRRSKPGIDDESVETPTGRRVWSKERMKYHGGRWLLIEELPGGGGKVIICDRLNEDQVDAIIEGFNRG